MSCFSVNTALALADGLLVTGDRQQLAAHLAECGICRQLVAELVRADAEAEPDAEPISAGERGVTIGRYEIVERLGAGGFGVVYRAKDPELQRDVALKLLRVQTDDPNEAAGARERMLREAQALAQLSHPNVMAIHDVGTVDDEVFLAGEFVAGQPLRRWLEGERTTAEILAVFIQTGEGLSAAHDAGMVHRDVKPENILVGDDGRVRVVDFGLARAATGAPKEVSDRHPQSLRETITMTGSLSGTPAYMSPEQHRGEEADARSDQFSFCVALYEALCGVRPFAGDSYDELRRNVLDGAGRSPPSRLPGWLRAALMRGLARDPAARFDSMRELVAELSRERSGRGKMLAVIAGGLALASVAAVAVVWNRDDGTAPCTGARDRLAGVWDDAARSKVAAAFERVPGEFSRESYQRVRDRLDRYTDDWVAMHTSICQAGQRGELSDRGFDRQMACLERRRREVEIFAGKLADADRALVERGPRAITQLVDLDGCAGAAVSDLPALPDDPRAAGEVERLRLVLSEIAGLRWAGEYSEALERARSALGAAEHTEHGPLIAEAMYAVGLLHSYLERPGEAERLLTDAHHEATSSRHTVLAAKSAIELVLVAGDMQRRVDDGTRWARHADAELNALADDGRLRADLENNLGAMYFATGAFSTAREHHERALTLREKHYGERDRSVAQSLNNIALAFYAEGDLQSARERFAAARDIFAEVLGPSHPYVGITAANLGNLHRELGELDRAEELLSTAVNIAIAADGETSKQALDARLNLAIVAAERGRHAEARTAIETILSQQRATLGEDHTALLLSRNSLGTIAMDQGDADAAVGHFSYVFERRKQTLGVTHADTLFSEINLATALLERGDAETALTHFEHAAAVLARSANRPLRDRAVIGRADARLAVADTVWRSDRARATELARAAKADYVSVGVAGAAGLEKARAWLKARGVE